MKYYSLIHTVLLHKWFIFLAGIKLRVPLWRLLIHDWSKFLPSEFPHYQKQFYEKTNDPVGFSLCWLRHQNRNSHHWGYWIPKGEGAPPLNMELGAIKEMIADWIGAEKAYSGQWPSIENWIWCKVNTSKMRLSYRTQLHVLNEVNKLSKRIL